MLEPMTHLEALLLRLSNERARLRAAKTPAERAAREVTVAQCEREVAGEEKFLAKTEMTNDEILAALEG